MIAITEVKNNLIKSKTVWFKYYKPLPLWGRGWGGAIIKKLYLSLYGLN
jgi:hypothetical protein